MTLLESISNITNTFNSKLAPSRKIILEFLQGELQKQGDAQALMLGVFNTVLKGYNPVKDPLKSEQMTLINQSLDPSGNGFLVKTIENMYGHFEIILSGFPVIYDYEGNLVIHPQYKTKYKDEELNYNSRAYFTVKNLDHKENYYGVFYNYEDAVYACEHNEVIRLDEITS